MIDYPRTREEARLYRYSTWAGNPTGTPYRGHRCAMEVWEKGRTIFSYQCHRDPGFGPDGLYCRQHAKKVERKEQPK